MGFTCPFHGWTYGLDGKLVGVPDASGFFDLDKGKLGLRQLALDVWEGFIFVNMDEKPSQTLEEAMGEQGRDLVGYPFASGQAVFEYEGTINCNWKSMIDSFCETYHVPVLHRHSVKDTLAGPDNPYGRLIDCRLKGPHRTQSVWGNMAYTPNPVQGLAWQNAPGPAVTSGVVDASVTLPKGLNETRATHWSLDVTVFFPNWIIVMGSGMYFTHQMWPLAANKVVWQMRGFLRPASNAAQRFGQENSMVELRDAVLEDCNTLERIQTAQDEGLITEMVYHDHEIALRHQYQPDFMVVHPGGLDCAGHRFGGESQEYRNQAVAMDDQLAQVVPQWLAAGYEILITADHGMNADGQHGGSSQAEREVPLFCLSSHFEPGTYVEGLSQLAIAPLLCQLLSLPVAEAMRSIVVPGFRGTPTPVHT